MMKKNEKIENASPEKQDCEREDPRARRLKGWLLGVRIAFCIFLAVTVCLCCVSIDLVQLRAQTSGNANGFDDRIRIYIDQGHNPAPYHNSGAEGNGLYEQDLTFQIGCLLAELLRKDGRFEVCLSRPEPDTVLGFDNTSSLQARVDGAADFRADYFISLHINAYTQDTANGAEALVMSGDRESHALADALLDGLLASTGLRDRGVKENSALYVLKNASMPAVLLEMGFITNGSDAALLAECPECFAEGIYNGILDCFDSLNPRNTPNPLEIRILLGVTVMTACVCAALITAGFVIAKKYKLIAQEKKAEIQDEISAE